VRKDTGFMGTTRRLRRVVDRRISMAGWWPWFANVPLLAAVLTGLILLTSALVERLPGPQDVRTIGAILAGFFSYWATWVVVGWLHVKRLRWAMRALYR